jgi:hypothetical protein
MVLDEICIQKSEYLTGKRPIFQCDVVSLIVDYLAKGGADFAQASLSDSSYYPYHISMQFDSGIHPTPKRF